MLLVSLFLQELFLFQVYIYIYIYILLLNKNKKHQQHVLSVQLYNVDPQVLCDAPTKVLLKFYSFHYYPHLNYNCINFYLLVSNLKTQL